MTNIVSDTELEVHLVTIEGPNINTKLYLYGDFSLEALKEMIAKSGVESAPKPRRKYKPRKSVKADLEALTNPVNGASEQKADGGAVGSPKRRRGRKAMWPAGEAVGVSVGVEKAPF